MAFFAKMVFDGKPWVLDEPFGVVGAYAGIGVEPADDFAKRAAVDSVDI